MLFILFLTHLSMASPTPTPPPHSPDWAYVGQGGEGEQPLIAALLRLHQYMYLVWHCRLNLCRSLLVDHLEGSLCACMCDVWVYYCCEGNFNSSVSLPLTQPSLPLSSIHLSRSILPPSLAMTDLQSFLQPAYICRTQPCLSNSQSCTCYQGNYIVHIIHIMLQYNLEDQDFAA